MTYPETIEFLFNSLPVFQHTGGGAYKAGLDNITALCVHLGDPQERFRSVHVAGTNGKGSVSHMAASVLTASGMRTGLFTSPHLRDFRERIRIDGETIPEETVVEFVKNNRDAIDRIQPSFFELTTAMAFDWFARAGVDVAVIETGMGGRLDSTNIVSPIVSVITNIGLDHTQFLGETLQEVAGEKAGIIKPQTPVVVGESDIETKLVFIDTAREKGAPILFADQCYRVVETIADNEKHVFRIKNLMHGNEFELYCDLQGIYQRKNIITALTLFDILNGAGRIPLSQEAVRRGLSLVAASTGLMGRWQVIGRGPLIVCDTGHNAEGIREVAVQISRQEYEKLYMVMGFVSDKDIEKVLPLLPLEAHYIFTKASIPRALGETALAERAAAYGLRGETAPTVARALARAKELASPADMIFIGGSTFVVAEAL